MDLWVNVPFMSMLLLIYRRYFYSCLRSLPCATTYRALASFSRESCCHRGWCSHYLRAEAGASFVAGPAQVIEGGGSTFIEGQVSATVAR